MKAILLDIDHTVSDAFWRDHLVGNASDPDSWDNYHWAGVNDKPIQEILDMLRVLSTAYFIVGVTARPERWRKMTMEWLLKYNVPIDELLMRPDNDFSRAPELKIILAQRHFEGKLNDDVAFVLDDREDVVCAFRAIGITALQVHAKRGLPQ